MFSRERILRCVEVAELLEHLVGDLRRDSGVGVVDLAAPLFFQVAPQGLSDQRGAAQLLRLGAMVDLGEGPEPPARNNARAPCAYVVRGLTHPQGWWEGSR